MSGYRPGGFKNVRDIRGVMPRRGKPADPQSSLEFRGEAGELDGGVPARQMSADERTAIRVRLGLETEEGKRKRLEVIAEIELCQTLGITPKQLAERRAAGIPDNPASEAKS